MKRARANDYWRRLYKQQYQWSCQEVSFAPGGNAGGITLRLNGAITVICGGNGVGKSTLLKLACFGIDSSVIKTIELARHRGASITAIVTINGSNASRTATIGSQADATPPSAGVVRIVDPSSAAQHIKRLIYDQENFSELLDPLESRVLAENEIGELSYMVGKPYSSVEVYEIEEYSDIEAFPYFRVECEGTEYGFEDMGAGEAALFYLWWFMSTSPESSFALLEEPENNVSLRSQTAAMNVIARICAERRIWCVLTTHSAEVVGCVPREHVRLVVRHEGQTVLTDGPTDELLESTIGLRIPRSCIAICEDRLARIVIRSIVRHRLPSIQKRLVVCDAGSNGDITKALDSFPESDELPKMVGVCDGDQRGAASATRHQILFLPGALAPEVLLKNAIAGKAASLAQRLKVDDTRVVAQLAALAGLDHHDWLIDFSKGLGINFETVVDELVAFWLDDPGIAGDLDAFVNGLNEIACAQ